MKAWIAMIESDGKYVPVAIDMENDGRTRALIALDDEGLDWIRAISLAAAEEMGLTITIFAFESLEIDRRFTPTARSN